MSSIADASYLGNSYGQTYNSVGQFDVLNTSELDVAGNLVVDGQLNGQVKSGYVTGYISADDLLALTGGGANSRAFRTTSGAADISGSGAFSNLTDAEKGTLLVLPQNAIPIQAVLCRTGSTDFANSGTDPAPDINVSSRYDPSTDSATGLVAGLAELYAGLTQANLNTGVPRLVNNSGGTADLGDIGSIGITGDNVVTITTTLGGTYTAADELKIRISYIIVPSSSEFLNNY